MRLRQPGPQRQVNAVAYRNIVAQASGSREKATDARPGSDYLTTRRHAGIPALEATKLGAWDPRRNPHPAPPLGVNMASFIPFLSELLPMVMPASTHVVRAKDIGSSNPTVEGPVVQRLAVVDRCGMCASGTLLAAVEEL